MPAFERTPGASGPVVQSYSRGGFAIEGDTYRAVLLTPDWALAWDPPELEALTIDHVEAALALGPPPEFLILGTGARHLFPPRSLAAALVARGIGLEPMDSRAAARTWGMLRAEERWIAAALLPLDK